MHFENRVKQAVSTRRGVVTPGKCCDNLIVRKWSVESSQCRDGQWVPRIGGKQRRSSRQRTVHWKRRKQRGSASRLMRHTSGELHGGRNMTIACCASLVRRGAESPSNVGGTAPLRATHPERGLGSANDAVEVSSHVAEADGIVFMSRCEKSGRESRPSFHHLGSRLRGSQLGVARGERLRPSNVARKRQQPHTHRAHEASWAGQLHLQVKLVGC